MTAARSVVLVGPTRRLRRGGRALADGRVGGGPRARRRRRRADAARRRHPRAPPTSTGRRPPRPTRWRSASSGPRRASTPTCAPRSSTSTRTAIRATDAAAVVGELFGGVRPGRRPPRTAAARADDRAAPRRPGARRRRDVPARRQLPRHRRARRRRVRARPPPRRATTRRTSSSSPAGPCPRAPSAASGSPATATTTRRAGASAASPSSSRSAPRSRSSSPTSPTRRRSAPPSTRRERQRRPARRRDPRRRRAARPADRAGDATRTTRSSSAPRPWRRSRSSTSCAGAAPSCSCSSRRRRTVLVPEGQAAYVAANSVLDALAGQHGDAAGASPINYGLWGELGIAADRRPPRAPRHRGRRAGRPSGARPSWSVERDGTVRLVGTLADRPPLGRRRAPHVRRRRRCCPGTGHLELLLAALDLAGGDDGVRLGPVTLLEPLVVPDGVPVTVRVSISGSGDDRWAQLESDGGVGAWRTAQRGEGRRRPATRPIGVATPQRSDGAVESIRWPGRRAQLELGPRWHSVVEAWRAGDDVVGRAGSRSTRRTPASSTRGWPIRRSSTWRRRSACCSASARSRSTCRSATTRVDRWARAAGGAVGPGDRASRRPTEDLLRRRPPLGDDDGRGACEIDGLALRPIAEPAALAAPTVDEAMAGAEPTTTAIAPLVALAERHGIRADEGAELLERLLATRRPRLIASSIELDDLRRSSLAPPSPTPSAATAHRPARLRSGRRCSARSARSGSTCSACPTSATTTTSSTSAVTR